MKQNIISEITLYRYRYIIGYALFLLFLVTLLIIAGFFIPGGITKAEQASSVASMNIEFRPPFNLPIVDLPYHLLQKASISLFGLSDIAIKLPSLVLAFISGISLLFLLRAWFKTNVALLAGLISISASQFLIVAQSGTPTITLFFWSIILLLAATFLSRTSRFNLLWKVIFSITAALSLYTPLSIYVLGAMLLSAALHPHLRNNLIAMSKLKMAIALFAGAIVLAPLFIRLVREPLTALILLGVDNIDWSMAAIWSNIQLVAQNLFGFAAPSIGVETITPLYGIPVAILMLLGLMRVIVDHHSARAYALAIWLIPLTLILIFQPQLTAITFVPFMMLLAVGIETLIRDWYGLFPRNPYARIAALVPLVILVGGIVFSGVARYENSFRYNISVAIYYSHDLSLIRNKLEKSDGRATLVVPKAQKEFYAFLNREYPNLIVTDRLESATKMAIVAPKTLKNNVPVYDQPTELITNAYSKDSLRFYVYKTKD